MKSFIFISTLLLFSSIFTVPAKASINLEGTYKVFVPLDHEYIAHATVEASGNIELRVCAADLDYDTYCNGTVSKGPNGSIDVAIDCRLERGQEEISFQANIKEFMGTAEREAVGSIELKFGNFSPFKSPIHFQKVSKKYKKMTCHDLRKAERKETLSKDEFWHWAIRKGDFGAVRQIWAEEEIDVNASGGMHGTTPLITALLLEHSEMVEFLIYEAKADVNAPGERNSVPLHVVENADLAKALLKAGAKVNRPDSFGWTSLMFAALNGHVAIVQIFLDAGADVNAKTKKGKTALSLAIENGETETEKLLRKHGAK